MPRPLLAVLALAALGLAGCHHRDLAPSDDDVPGVEAEALASDAMDSSEASAQGASLGRLFSLTLDAGSLSSPKKAFDRVLGTGDQLVLFAGLLPLKCLRATAAPADHTVRLSFDNCHGPPGVSHLSGAIDGQFVRLDGDAMLTHIASQPGLAANGAPASYTADLYASIQGTVRDLTLHSKWAGVTRKGHEVEHTSDLNVLVDTSSRCVDISGTTRGTVQGRTTETLIDGYRVCPRQCPSAGSITSTARKSGHSIVVRFDGSNAALVTTSHGREIAVPLLCDLED
jgi:hypothetical protein